eukprot:GILI01004456.1.p1 GENE.GILI01004456.1~~GILI01004456.1.p1  ORF type:complete len:344 (-),score=41.27 GILI01004456.1:37-1068(-)
MDIKVTGPVSETVVLQDHVGVCGCSVQVIAEEYSPSVRKYIVRRRTPHSSPDATFLGTTIGNAFSMFDIVLVAFSLLLFVPSLTTNTADFGGQLGGAFAESSSVVSTYDQAAAGDNNLGLDTERTLLTEIAELVEGTDDGQSYFDSLTHMFKSVIPWYVLSHIEGAVATVLSIFPHKYRWEESGWLVNNLSPSVFWTIAIAVFVAVKVPLRMRQIAEEEILVIQGVGIQVTIRNFLGTVVSQRFIDASLIRSIFIHEGFFRHRVIFFLAVLIENRSDLEVLFQESLPRLAALRPILSGIRTVLYPSKKEFGPSLADLASGKGSGPATSPATNANGLFPSMPMN